MNDLDMKDIIDDMEYQLLIQQCMPSLLCRIQAEVCHTKVHVGGSDPIYMYYNIVL